MDNRLPKTLFFRKSQDKIKKISGIAYYNCGKKGHIARGYHQNTWKPKTAKKKVKKGLEKPYWKAAAA